jgi:hypothetical protein
MIIFQGAIIMNKRLICGLAELAVVFSGAGTLPVGTFEGFSLSDL